MKIEILSNKAIALVAENYQDKFYLAEYISKSAMLDNMGLQGITKETINTRGQTCPATLFDMDWKELDIYNPEGKAKGRDITRLVIKNHPKKEHSSNPHNHPHNQPLYKISHS